MKTLRTLVRCDYYYYGSSVLIPAARALWCRQCVFGYQSCATHIKISRCIQWRKTYLYMRACIHNSCTYILWLLQLLTQLLFLWVRMRLRANIFSTRWKSVTQETNTNDVVQNTETVDLMGTPNTYETRTSLGHKLTSKFTGL